MNGTPYGFGQSWYFFLTMTRTSKLSLSIVTLELQTRPPGTEVKSADLLQSSLERAHEAFVDVGAKGSLHRHKMGLHRRKLDLPSASDLGDSLSLSPKIPFAPPARQLSINSVDVGLRLRISGLQC